MWSSHFQRIDTVAVFGVKFWGCPWAQEPIPASFRRLKSSPCILWLKSTMNQTDPTSRPEPGLQQNQPAQPEHRSNWEWEHWNDCVKHNFNYLFDLECFGRWLDLTFQTNLQFHLWTTSEEQNRQTRAVTFVSTADGSCSDSSRHSSDPCQQNSGGKDEREFTGRESKNSDRRKVKKVLTRMKKRVSTKVRKSPRLDIRRFILLKIQTRGRTDIQSVSIFWFSRILKFFRSEK